MKAVNIDVYLPYFKLGGITDGKSLESINMEALSVSVAMQCTVHVLELHC